MDTQLLFQDANGFATPMLAVLAVDVATGKDAEPLVALLTTSDAISNAASQVIATGEFRATLGELLLLHKPDGLRAERLLVVGLGKAKALSVESVRKAAGAAVRAAKPRGVREMAIFMPGASRCSGLPSSMSQPSGQEISASSLIASGQILQRNCMS